MNEYEMSETQLQQSLAANRWFMEYIERKETADRKLRIYLIVGLLVFVLMMGVLISGVNSIYAMFSQGTVVETVYETEQTVDGEDAIINNGDFEQYNDSSTKEVTEQWLKPNK